MPVEALAVGLLQEALPCVEPALALPVFKAAELEVELLYVLFCVLEE